LREVLRLQAEQTDLLGRLARLQIDDLDRNERRQEPRPRAATPPPQEPVAIEPEPARITIGVLVRIRNPRPNQPTRSRVVRIDRRFVSVLGSNGVVVRREPHNLEVEAPDRTTNR
jgi:hypothetical protein